MPVAKGKRISAMKNKNTEINESVFEEMMMLRAGPMPLPEDMEKYERILPGFTERFMRLTEGEADHRRSLEKRVIYTETKAITRGQYLGLGATGIIMGFALIFVILGAKEVAMIVGGGAAAQGIATIVNAFRHKQNKEDSDKSKK